MTTTSAAESATSGWNFGPSIFTSTEKDGQPFPTGLNELVPISEMLIEQKVEAKESQLGVIKTTSYSIKSKNVEVMTAFEQSPWITNFIFRQERPMKIEVFDRGGHKIIDFDRGLRCQGCCFPCYLQKMFVYSPSTNLIGWIRQTWGLRRIYLEIMDDQSEPVLKVKGPVFTAGIANFKINRLGGKNVGVMTKLWHGIEKTSFEGTNHWKITVPAEVNSKIKACILGSCLLLDVMNFDRSENLLDSFGTNLKKNPK